MRTSLCYKEHVSYANSTGPNASPGALLWFMIQAFLLARHKRVYLPGRGPAADVHSALLFAPHTLNNPLKYVDPSGHDVCDEEGYCYNRYGSYRGIRTGLPPDPNEPELTKADPGGYGGDEIMQLYYLMKSDTDAWWYDDGDFTFEEFNGLLAIHEGAGNELYANLWAIMSAQQLYVGGFNDPYCQSGPCMNGTFNFWAAYSGSSWMLVNMYVKGDKDIKDYVGYGGRGISSPADTMKQARILGNSILHPKVLDPRRNDSLSNCGNDPSLVTKLLNTLITSQDDIKPNTFYPGGNQGIYYYTQNGYGVWYSVNGWNKWMP